MNPLIAIATFAVTWFVARLILLRYLRYRRRTVAGQEWQEYKARLPGWVKQTEMVFQVFFWLTITFLFIVGSLAAHNAVRTNGDRPGGLSFGLILFSSLFAALVPAFILANGVSWLIPPMRKANLLAFEGLQTASYRTATMGLAKFGSILLPICGAVSLFAIFEPWAR
jgi:hypothetical protein